VLSILAIVATIYGIYIDKKQQDDLTQLEKLVLSFSVVENTRQLCEVDNRYAVLDTIRFCLTFILSSGQNFFLAVGFTPYMLKSIVDSAVYELFFDRAYWFLRTPGLWSDIFVFTM